MKTDVTNAPVTKPLEWHKTVDGRWLTWTPTTWALEKHLARHGLVDRSGWYLQEYRDGAGPIHSRVWLATRITAAKELAARRIAGAQVIYLATLQFANGGLVDAMPTDYLIHLVRGTRQGTPGPTLCGIDRFAQNGPGWSVGGGVDAAGMVHTPCEGCADAARRDFAGLPIAGMRPLSTPMAEALGVRAHSHSIDALRVADAPEVEAR